MVLEQIIIAATDGVWDNLFEPELLQLLKPSATSSSATPPTPSSPEVMARAISEASHLHGKDERFMSPFAVNAARHGLSFAGGKLDDVTVVVSRVCNVAPTSTARAPQSQSTRRPGLMRSASGLSVEKRGADSATVGDLEHAGATSEYMSSPVSSAESSND